ncbi:uncharacterized protein DFL_002897 [Arthrobotrys flagrans]|uniref:Uncharacterized protein n=1 Tax=Arthrobotrys flagrans TaxID=97331 RepID=A0A437ABZ4_ARTFL|nr:hypothetical protein DFL_002897 [Arthrobotrys flagrans]
MGIEVPLKKVRDVGAGIIGGARDHLGGFLEKTGTKIQQKHGNPVAPAAPPAGAGVHLNPVQGFDDQSHGHGSPNSSNYGSDGGVSRFSMQTRSSATSFGDGGFSLMVARSVEVDELEIDGLQISIPHINPQYWEQYHQHELDDENRPTSRIIQIRRAPVGWAA